MKMGGGFWPVGCCDSSFCFCLTCINLEIKTDKERWMKSKKEIRYNLGTCKARAIMSLSLISKVHQTSHYLRITYMFSGNFDQKGIAMLRKAIVGLCSPLLSRVGVVMTTINFIHLVELE